MSSLRDEYDEQWKDYQSAGPGDWRRAYHGHPDPEFETLCREADSRDLIVELFASSVLYGVQEREDRHRKLLGLIVGPVNGKPVLTVEMTPNESLRSAAARARKMLEAA